MQKIEIIKKAIISNEEKIAELKTERSKVEESKTDALSRMYLKYFGECLVNDDTIEVSDTYCYFKRFDSDYNYHKEMLSISVRPLSWRNEEADKIETSYYSTSTNNEFELKRMILIGKVGQVILDFQDDIIAEYNSTRASFKVEISKFNREIWALEKKVREMNSEINTIENDALMKKVEIDGIEFEVDEENLYRLPDLDVRFDWNVKNIKKIKVTSKTKSGKSGDLELVTVRKNWNSEKDEYETVYYTNTYERVRMDKISYLVSWNKDIIVD
ncbi:MAG: hypothetical protein L7S72_07305 [Flavobacteriales bacterium]|nr:hypothetical protein [Flavobacteriales bacterium]